MPFRDLRGYLACLESEHELVHVRTEVDWNLELGAISRRAMDRRAPALLFENIKGYPPSYSVLANILARSQQFDYSRFALAMDAPKNLGALELIEEFVQRMDRRIPPRLVETGPCKENILKGDDVNLLQFPVPLLKGPDGGRFIGTWHINVTKDPDTGWVNWGMYRHMIHDERSVGWLAPPVQHGPSLFYGKYESRNEPMPMAVVIGTEPISTIMAGTPLPANAREVEAAGGIRGEPVELVKCETIDLEVPATAEIVLEGHVLPHERRLEGPFGEFTGYAAGDRLPRPVFQVECITHRNNPILTVSNVGKPWEEESVMGSITWSAALVDDLRKRGIYFKSLYVAPPLQAIIVSCDPPYAGYQHTLAAAIWSSKFGINRAYIFIVGEDVDVTNIEDVWWCLTTRVHPVNGIHVQRNTNAFALWPFISDEERSLGQGCKVYFDATFPAHWPKEKLPTTIDFKHGWPEEIQELVLNRWSEYGIP